MVNGTSHFSQDQLSELNSILAERESSLKSTVENHSADSFLILHGQSIRRKLLGGFALIGGVIIFVAAFTGITSYNDFRRFVNNAAKVATIEFFKNNENELSEIITNVSRDEASRAAREEVEKLAEPEIDRVFEDRVESFNSEVDDITERKISEMERIFLDIFPAMNTIRVLVEEDGLDFAATLRKVDGLDRNYNGLSQQVINIDAEQSSIQERLEGTEASVSDLDNRLDELLAMERQTEAFCEFFRQVPADALARVISNAARERDSEMVERIRNAINDVVDACRSI